MPPFYSHETRTQVVSLVLVGKIPPKQVANIFNIPDGTIYKIIKRATERGFDPSVSPYIEKHHITDAPRSGRPKAISEATQQGVIDSVTKDRCGREKSCEYLAYEAGISESSVLRILNSSFFRKCKPTWKPGLTNDMRQKRLAFALEHQHWTLEDWKNVIWTDETSVILGQRRGAQRVWRRIYEKFDPTCIRKRYKKASEFMFWGSFSYDRKGPCHIYEPESAAAKKKAEQELEIANRERFESAKSEWELNNSFQRLRLRPATGHKPQFKFTAKTGKLVRRNGNGIDWYRYQKVIYFLI
jgi:transposase